MGLGLFDGCNYTLQRESTETQREFAQHEQGKVTAGWEMWVPPPGPDGVPYQIIFVGPTPEHRGGAIRLHMVTQDGGEIPDDARSAWRRITRPVSSAQSCSRGPMRS